MTPFRSEKNTNWEGAFRVPLMVRWPGKIAAGVVSNEIVQHHDWLPTFLAAAGEPDIVEKLKAGHEAGEQDLQGAHRRLQPAAVPDRRGGQEPAPGLHLLLRRRRPASRSASTTGRSSSWSSGCRGRCEVWAEPFVPLRVPKLFNLRTDPFERADITSNTYYDWFIDQGYLVLAATGDRQPSSSRRSRTFPPRQKAASFTIDQALEKMEAAPRAARTS